MPEPFWHAPLLVTRSCTLAASRRGWSLVVCSTGVGRTGRRDTLRFCLPDNRGGYLHTGNDAHLIGHVWVEVGDEIADFSVGD